MDSIKRYDTLRAAFDAFSPADEIATREALQAAKIIGFSESLKIKRHGGVLDILGELNG
jgi:hypothetical protein